MSDLHRRFPCAPPHDELDARARAAAPALQTGDAELDASGTTAAASGRCEAKPGQVTRSAWLPWAVVVATAMSTVLPAALVGGCGRNDIIDVAGSGGSDTWSVDTTDDTDADVDADADTDTDTDTDDDPPGFCGDGIVDPFESCDLGGNNGQPGFDCTFDCQLDFCGNGHVGADEQCDQGALNGTGDFCRADCMVNFCGDEYIGPGEQCDDGGPTPNCNQFCAFPTCGDQILDIGEECDFGIGNGVPGSNCTAMCEFNECGDGHLGALEECDDGAANGNGGPCKLSCELNFCGDSYVGPGEACDEGGPTPTCTADCALPSCGDGEVQQGEECDLGDQNGVPGAACTAACTTDVCGDSHVGPDEDCDLGAQNGVPGSTCTATCTADECGDEHLGPDEECDDGALNGTGGECRSDCVLNTCPDGYVGPGEQCDEGGATPTCTALCTLPQCGDSVVDVGEECDDGDLDNTDECTTLCKLPVCGDGFIQPALGETCDDSNLVEGDGCHTDCRPSGEPYWWIFWDQEGRNDIAYGVETDAQGNGYVVGRVVLLQPFEHAEAFLRKYDPDGNLIWEQRYWGGFQNSFAFGLGLDPQGRPIMTGRIQVSGQGGNIFVRKYDADGGLMWADEFNGIGTSASTDLGRDVAVDGDGNAYVAGETTVDGENFNAWMRKYDSVGGIVWTRTFNGADNSAERAAGVAVLTGGDVVFVGETWVSGQGENIWIRRVNANDGAQVHQIILNAQNSTDRANAVTAYPDGGYAVAGTIWVSGQSQNIWAARFGPTNANVWVHTWNNATSNSEDLANGVDVTANGDVVITGTAFDNVTNRDVVIRRLAAADGAIRWTTITDFFGFADIGQGIDVDLNGDLWVCGERQTAATNGNDLWVAKVRP